MLDENTLIVPSMSKDLLAGILDNPILLGFSGLIIVLFLFYLLRMFRQYSRVVRTVNAVSKGLMEISEVSNALDLRKKSNEAAWQKQCSALLNAGRFDEVFDKQKNDISKIWMRMKDHFIWFGDRSMPYLGSGTVDQLFSVTAIRSTFVSDRLNRKGALFTSLGVLGTFLGLSYGVAQASSGLASADITLARQAMSDLLSGAQLAFVTSLLGLMFSMLYGLVLERKKDKVTERVQYLQHLLNIIFPSMNAAYAGAQQAAALHKQQEEFGKIMERIATAADQTSKQIGELRKELPEGVDHGDLKTIQQLLHKQHDSIGLLERIAYTSLQTSNSLNGIHESLKETRSSQSGAEPDRSHISS